MIPSMTLDLTTAFEWFGWAGVGFVVAALGGVLVVALIPNWRAKPEAESVPSASGARHLAGRAPEEDERIRPALGVASISPSDSRSALGRSIQTGGTVSG